MSPETYTKPIRRTFFKADLKCYMCGSVAGSIESEQSFLEAAQTHPPLLLRRAGMPQQALQVYNWLDERPRRGRPPKRLIEERRRERELLNAEEQQPAAA